MSGFRIQDLTELREANLRLSTWKLLCTCPKCGKGYLFSDMKACMVFKWSWRNFLPFPFNPGHNKTWFGGLPENLFCVRCGSVKPEDVKCHLPIAAIPVGMIRLIFISSLVVYGLIAIIVLICFLVNNRLFG